MTNKFQTAKFIKVFGMNILHISGNKNKEKHNKTEFTAIYFLL